MALANLQTAQTYLQFLPVLQNLPKQPFLLLYDDEADVLYIDFYNPPKSSDDSILHASQRTESILPIAFAA